jgi:hypothetical protein
MKVFTLIVLLSIVNVFYSQAFEDASGKLLVVLERYNLTVLWSNQNKEVIYKDATYVGEVKEKFYDVLKGEYSYISYSKYKVDGGVDYFLLTPCVLLYAQRDNCWEIEFFNEFEVSYWGLSKTVTKTSDIIDD